MKRFLWWAERIAIGLAGLVLVVVLAVLVIVQTQWFRDYVRQTVISSVEKSTGGRVEIGSFNFEVRQLRATITDFVIHGKEPKDTMPFVRVARVELRLRLFTSFHRLYELSYLGVEKPQVNVMVLADGNTNIPTPKEKSTSDTTALETVVDLAVGRFELTNGVVNLESVRQPVDVRANNVRAQLDYSLLTRSYEGRLTLEPVYVMNGRNTPVNFAVTVPVKIGRDRIDVQHALVSTSTSALTIDAAMQDMRHPVIDAQVNGHLSTADIRSAANVPIPAGGNGVPGQLELAAKATVSEQAIRVTGVRATFGASNMEASGALKDPKGAGKLEFKAELALKELALLAGPQGKNAVKPGGVVRLNGTASLDANNHYDVGGNIEGRDISIADAGRRFSGINLYSAFHVDPHRVGLNGLTLHALGGDFTGNVQVEELARYQVDGKLNHLNIAAAAGAAGVKLPYSGVVSGPLKAEGDLSKPGMTATVAEAHLAIAPAGGKGIPVSGRLNAKYSGSRDDVTVQDSYVALPHSRLTLAGSLNHKLNVTLATRDLNELLAAAPGKSGPPPVSLKNGEADFAGTVTGGLSAPRLAGHVAVKNFAVEDRLFNSLQADVEAAPTRAAVANGTLTRGAMQARFDGAVALRNWSPTPNSAVMANVALRNGDIADLAVLAGQPSTGYAGAVTADAQVRGTVGNPLGTLTADAANGQLDGEAFRQAKLQVNLSDQLVTVPAAYIETAAGRVSMTGQFRHPRESFSTGRIDAHVQTDQLNAGQLQTVQKWQPGAGGTLRVNADVSADLGEEKGKTTFDLNRVNGTIAARMLRFEGQNYGDLDATARTNGNTVAYNLTSDFAGSKIQVSGNTQLSGAYQTSASGTIAGLPVERVLTLAKQTGIPARGLLAANFQVNGNMDQPEGSAELRLSQGVVYGETISQALLRVTYRSQSVDVPELEITSGPSRLALSAHYDHAAGDFETGTARIEITSGHLDLGRLRNVQEMRSGLAGVLEVKGSAAARIQPGAAPKTGVATAVAPQILLTALNADVSSSGIQVNGKNYGQLKLAANTTGANKVHVAVDSSLAGAVVRGSGDATLSGDYPVNGELSFRNVEWKQVAGLIGVSGSMATDFDAELEGEARVNGPVLKTDQMNGSLTVSKLALRTTPRTAAERPITIANQGPVQIAMERGVVRIQNAHLAGPDTDLQLGGTAALPAGALNVSLNGKVDIGLLQKFDRDFYSAGKIEINTVARGTIGAPLVNGRLTLENASLNYGSAPLGIANANGTVVFNGNNAQIQALTAESGGGKVKLSGFGGFSNGVRFGLQANATNVRVRVQQGVSLKADADIRLAGTTAGSRVTGAVTINQVTYAPQSDIGSILTRAAPPVQAPTAPSPLLDNMQLDIRVRTASGAQLQASLAQNLQAEADLRIRGTANEPAVLGRVTVDSGQLVFFGATYTVDTGTISFYNPVRIEPILDVSLVTQAKGVNVTLRVTGPIDNMKLSYTSDPPLQFQEIVSLLASGKAPTSDPTLLANQPAAPQQGFQQMGESALLGQAVANPVASRLQRVFGVTQLKIDPSFTTGSDVPTARVSLQQRITSNLTFTYVSALDDPNSTTIRIEWAFNQQFSAVATRDSNGIFSVNFFYKKEFR